MGDRNVLSDASSAELSRRSLLTRGGTVLGAMASANLIGFAFAEQVMADVPATLLKNKPLHHVGIIVKDIHATMARVSGSGGAPGLFNWYEFPPRDASKPLTDQNGGQGSEPGGDPRIWVGENPFWVRGKNQPKMLHVEYSMTVTPPGSVEAHLEFTNDIPGSPYNASKKSPVIELAYVYADPDDVNGLEVREVSQALSDAGMPLAATLAMPGEPAHQPRLLAIHEVQSNFFIELVGPYVVPPDLSAGF